jgi:capsular polysaccharide biosynthesis protein
MTTMELEHDSLSAASASPMRRRRWRDIATAAAASLFVALGAFVVSSGISPTYQSSAQLRIVVNEANGLSQDALQASNALTAQLVQLLPTDAVLTRPARELGISVSALRSGISVGSVSQQNLLQITASAGSAAAAKRRAATVTQDFMNFMVRDVRTQLGAYLRDVSNALRGTKGAVAQLGAVRGGVGGGAQTAVAPNLNERSLLNDLTQRATGNIPVIQQVQPATLGDKVSPKPALAAAVALLIAGFLAVQAIMLLERRRKGGAG